MYSTNRYNAFIPSHEHITGLMVRETGQYNDFEEDVGEVVATAEGGKLAPVKLEALLQQMNYNIPSVLKSFSEKVAFLEFLKTQKRFTRLDIILKNEFQVSRAEHAAHKTYMMALASNLPHHAYLLDVPYHPNPAIESARLLAPSIFSTLDSQDSNMMAALYDKIKEVLSYGANTALDPTSYIQIIPNGIAIDLDDYARHPPISPFSPQGDIRTTEEFSILTSLTFDTSGRIIDKNVEDAYEFIINGAETRRKVDANALRVLNKTSNYLYARFKDQHTGEEYISDSLEHAKYKNLIANYNAALAAYQAAKLSYDSAKSEDLKKWQADSVILRNKIDKAREAMDGDEPIDADNMTFNRGIPKIPRAINYVKSYGSNALINLIAEAKNLFANSKIKSQVTISKTFHVSYGIPSNWFSEECGLFSSFTFSPPQMDQHSKEASQYSGGESFSSGLLSVKEDNTLSSEEIRYRTTSKNFNIKFKLGTVAIQRPWMKAVLFGLSNWYLDGESQGKISLGVFPANDQKLNGRILPFYSTSFIIAKDVEISAEWSEKDLNILKQSLDTTTIISWGPFSLSGAFIHNKENFNSKLDGTTFKLPKTQIIGVINTIVPFSAPDNSD